MSDFNEIQNKANKFSRDFRNKMSGNRELELVILSVLCVIFPPASVFFTSGFNIHLLINFVLFLLGWVPGTIHAAFMLGRYSIKHF